ncbi:DUF4326 domain-containing protein [Parasedimentitalea psychrophila]|uniref:DUF4326 domain-containing protein n=1 Tax=Parasedimentitalea psychrophila TaxID=2997337 RepID=UPI0036F2033E
MLKLTLTNQDRSTQAEPQKVLDIYRAWMVKSETRLFQARHDLRGKDLACWY